jgi:hypothetical protein
MQMHYMTSSKSNFMNTSNCLRQNSSQTIDLAKSFLPYKKQLYEY